MNTLAYAALKERAKDIAGRLGPPSFYRRHKKAVERSLRSFSESTVLRQCRSYLDESQMHPAHGIDHGERVAIEAGAILLTERASLDVCAAETEDLMLCAQIAGLLHDIKRNESDHTTKGRAEAERILEDFAIKESHKRYITAAIRNHEAFKEILSSENEEAKLISDCLYDADKFRWGPDNFTITLWLIVEASETPIEVLYRDFLVKMAGVGRIKETFRTDTGKECGPEFIDLGVEIGKEIYREMANMLGY